VEAEVVQTLPKALEAMEILEDIMEVAVATLKVQTSTRLDGKFGKQDSRTCLKFLTGRRAFRHWNVIVTSYFLRARRKSRW
jgi:hypothetical protein